MNALVTKRATGALTCPAISYHTIKHPSYNTIHGLPRPIPDTGFLSFRIDSTLLDDNILKKKKKKKRRRKKEKKKGG
jgi:hypothetical protein